MMLASLEQKLLNAFWIRPLGLAGSSLRRLMAELSFKGLLLIWKLLEIPSGEKD